MVANDSTPDPKTLGERLRRVRLASGLDQAKLAEALDFTGQAPISRIEKGLRRVSAQELDRWCRACDVSVDAVLSGSPITVNIAEASA